MEKGLPLPFSEPQKDPSGGVSDSTTHETVRGLLILQYCSLPLTLAHV